MLTVGFTTIVGPLPIKFPPHEPVYQNQEALVPSVPPATVRLPKSPEQMELFEAKEPEGGVDSVSKDILVEAQLVVLHVPLAKTK